MKSHLLPNWMLMALVFCLFESGYAQGGNAVIRCGGFVQASSALIEESRSGHQADYSQISVSIVTRAGVIKETTECAPNGYYLLPIYESGDFSIKVEGPSGWEFDHSLVPIVTDNGECNNGERVNFEITGFSVSGAIRSPSCSQDISMAGVTVYLSKNGEQVDKYQFRGDTQNFYSFNNVQPGDYDISASHRSWSFSKNSASVHVTWGSVQVEDDLLISGYDISGKVLSSDGDAMEKVNMNLFFADSDLSTPKQSVQSDSEGKFRLENIPCSSYQLIPFYEEEHTSYDLVPNKVLLQVKGDSIILEEAFRVVGFSANGKLVDRDGNGISGVKILLDKQEQTVTNDQGNFRLEKLSSGEYFVEFRKNHFSFPSLDNIRISPNHATLPTVELSGVDICGKVQIDSAFHHKIDRHRSIHLFDADDNDIATTTSNEKGEYCFTSVPTKGSFKIIPQVLEGENSFLIFEPHQRQVTVDNLPIYDQDFTQSKVSLSGEIHCLEKPCSSSVILQLSSLDDSELRVSSPIDPNTGKFVIEGVYPGEYKVRVDEASWCWKEQEKHVSVKSTNLENLSFYQSGYKVSIQSSHAVDIKYQQKNAVGGGATPEIFKAEEGNNEFCVNQPGEYEFQTISCFKFNKEKFIFSTASPQELQLSVTHYPIKGSINAPAGTSSNTLSVAVTTSAGTERTLPVTSTDGESFSFSYWSSLGDEIEITPTSSSGLLFYPASQQISVQNSFSCPPEVDAFSARPGLFLEGIIEPEPLPGVEITVKQKTNEKIVLKVKSDSRGTYSAGPLYDHLQYTLSAHLDGYYFTNSANGFKAVELSQISIHAIDQYGKNIPGVLLSLTGDSAFYSDSDTNENGEGKFSELFPGTYYLRGLLKEYTFKPTNIPIDLVGGIDQKVIVNGTRVAFSAFGSVKSLNGDAERNVVVTAQSDVGDYEETQTDALGNFRLRGLKPELFYSFSVKSTEKIERASPSSLRLQIPTEDLSNIDFISFRDSHRVDIFGTIDCSDDFLDQLKLELYVYNKKQNQQELLKTISFDNFKSFDFPNLPKEEYILKLVSSLNTNLYEYQINPVDIDVPRLQSEGKLQNSRVFVPLTFRASLIVQNGEIANVSFYPLLILSLLFFVFWYRKHLHEYYQSRTTPQKVKKPSSWVPHHVTKHHEANKKANRR